METRPMPNVNSPGISNLKTSDIKWLKMLIKRKMFTKSAVSVIQSLIPPGSLILSESDTSSDGGDEYEMDGNDNEDNADDVLCLLVCLFSCMDNSFQSGLLTLVEKYCTKTSFSSLSLHKIYF